MADLGFERMQQMQRALQEKYRDKWESVCPATGRNKLLWMMIEAGEAADVIKKKGDGNIMSDAGIRKHFIEEMCDTLMYFNDVMLCYGITPDELEAVYTEKQETNMKRW
ncbi:MAG: nucleotide pyrophosphohydrolase [Eubacteriales bacterium]